MQNPRAVGADLHTGAELAQFGRLLVDIYVDAAPGERQRRRKPADTAADDGNVAVSAFDGQYAAPYRHQRTGTSRFHRFARAVQVEQIAHPVRPYRRHRAGRRITLDRHAGAIDEVTVSGAAGADKDGRVAAGQATGGVAGVFDGIPDMQHEQALLRIHQLGFLR